MGSRPAPGKRILIATIGSLGDLHPCLALGSELARRGHQVTVAASIFYQTTIEARGLCFHALPPNWDPTSRELIAQCEDLKSGVEVLFRRLILPALRGTYDSLLTAARHADLMLAGEMVYAAPLVAEKLRLPWASIILSPASFLSSDDPSITTNVPWLIHLRKVGRPVYRSALNLGRLLTRHWWEPVRALRKELGLRPECDPLFKDKYSTALVLALFSRTLAAPQPDWPPQTMQPGFVFLNHAAATAELQQQLSSFLESGSPPIVFTLGSTAVHNAGNFFGVSAEVARRVGRRAILLGVKEPLHSSIGANSTAANGSADILELRYAPYAEVFPHSAAIVHQGGSGTTGEALRAGQPMLIVPYGWDQPDNGARIERAGAGLCLPRAKYTPQRAAAALDRLLGDASFAARSASISQELRQENAVASSCDAIEHILYTFPM